MSNIDYTLWPNAGGTLGQNKVQIPDGVTTTWPGGDALVGNFVYNKGHLVGFVDTKALIANESKSTTFPYDYVNIQVDKSLEGVMTFNQGERTKYLTVTYSESRNSGDTIVLGTKYLGCTTVGEVKAVDPDYKTNDIVDGIWSQSLADLEIGVDMFRNCSNLTSFNSDLSSLTYGNNMFAYCSELTAFDVNLSALTECTGMFSYCSNLTSFNSDLSSLTSAMGMFKSCKLDIASVQHIAKTIPTQGSSIHIGIGRSAATPEDETAFQTIREKGWNVYVDYNPSTISEASSVTTLDETDETQAILTVYWAKPVPSDEKHARYTDSEGNYYNILGGNLIHVDDPDTYSMFTCEEDAAANMRLTPYIKPIERN